MPMPSLRGRATRTPPFHEGLYPHLHGQPLPTAARLQLVACPGVDGAKSTALLREADKPKLPLLLQQGVKHMLSLQFQRGGNPVLPSSSRGGASPSLLPGLGGGQAHAFSPASRRE